MLTNRSWAEVVCTSRTEPKLASVTSRRVTVTADTIVTGQRACPGRVVRSSHGQPLRFRVQPLFSSSASITMMPLGPRT